MKLTAFIGKKILSPSGEQLGYVTGAYLTKDLKKLASLSAADGEEEDFYLPARAVLACSDVLIAERTSTVPSGIPAPIGAGAYSCTGESMGIVSDWIDGTEPLFCIIREGVRIYCPADHTLAGEVLIYYPQGRPSKKTARRPAKRSLPAEQGDHVQDAQEEAYHAQVEQEESKAGEVLQPSAPSVESEEQIQGEHVSKPPLTQTNAICFDRRNLLGRVVRRTVFDSVGEPIVLAGERITPEVLSRARRRGRLLALTVNTLTESR